MGTRSLTYINQVPRWEPGLPTKSDDTLICIYRQYDGYPEGIGQDLYDFLSKVQLHNGYGLNLDEEYTHCNGAGCLAAQLVKYLKGGIGNVYLQKIEEPWQGWEEYVYAIFVPDEPGDIYMRIEEGENQTLIECPISEFPNALAVLVNRYEEEE